MYLCRNGKQYHPDTGKGACGFGCIHEHNLNSFGLRGVQKCTFVLKGINNLCVNLEIYVTHLTVGTELRNPVNLIG